MYGGNPGLRSWLEEEGISYVMAVACSEMVTTAAGRSGVDELAALVPASGWQRLSCADGVQGPRLYDWALIGTTSPGHQLRACRSLAPGEKGELELHPSAAGHPAQSRCRAGGCRGRQVGGEDLFR